MGGQVAAFDAEAPCARASKEAAGSHGPLPTPAGGVCRQPGQSSGVPIKLAYYKAKGDALICRVALALQAAEKPWISEVAATSRRHNFNRCNTHVAA